MNLFFLAIYVFELVVYYILEKIPGMGERFSGGFAGWSGGLISLTVLFQSGVIEYSSQSGKFLTAFAMITIVAMLVIILLRFRPDLRANFKFVIDCGIALGIGMPFIVGLLL